MFLILMAFKNVFNFVQRHLMSRYFCFYQGYQSGQAYVAVSEFVPFHENDIEGRN